ncbi:MAG: 50S ribosomal protein L15 [Oscillospiraceae bacterium]|nr:50S ribosomal protein L15 [Oscillospiraceae bacterium]MBP1552866.1 50S ribosomal protein L15 [Oscillospiraceae bacterium]MBQ5313733.1 50S ribosomal protein L15 [Oscillospiraceae bacterium]MBQ5325419.1 50S ribosomal protein L15 [Oscillospiraceae bacterium]
MMLHELKPAAGSNKAAKRKGRGHGSGNGKTAGYGHKGQKARSGATRPGFEGGQLPLQRRLPKVGFNNSVFATVYSTIKVSDLERCFEANAVVDEAAVVAAGLVKKTNDGIKVLGNGELTKPLTVELAAFTASAKEKIEKAGGKAEVK